VKRNAYTIACAAAIGLVASVVLTAAERLTEQYRVANASAEEVRTVLSVLGVPFDPEERPAELLSTFERSVRIVELEGVSFYSYSAPDSSGEITSVAFRFKGPGLWGPIEGFLALESDFRTIRAIAFHRQEETPGLGGEIGSDSFRSRFTGKKIVGPNGKPGLAIVKPGMAKCDNEVDGITGATMTSERLERILSIAIHAIVEKVKPDD